MLIWLLSAFQNGWNSPEVEHELTWERLCNDGMKPSRAMTRAETKAREFLEQKG